MTTSEEQIFYSVVTDIGIEKINEALETGRKIDLKYIAIGDGNGSYYEPNVNQTELVNETYRAEISSVDELTARARIPFDVGGFYIREAGIFDSENNLILVSKQPETYKPREEQAGFKDIWMKIQLTGINPNALVLKIDPNIQLCTLEQLLESIRSHKHPDLMAIRIYDKNNSGIVDTCELVDGGKFTDEEVDYDFSDDSEQRVMSANIYDKNNDGIVDLAESIDAGDF
ncbi:phage tail protein [bacterium]|nr:phage tail protein [bacterium]